MLTSTKEMRARIRELAVPNRDDFDRAVIAVVDDLEALLRGEEQEILARAVDNELAVTDNDTWLCEGCWDEWRPDDGGFKPKFSAAQRPPEAKLP